VQARDAPVVAPLLQTLNFSGVEMRQWEFIADMNFDQAITISDVWLWGKWLYFYPGDSIFFLLIDKFPAISSFFEIGYWSYGNFYSGIFSLFLWYLCGQLLLSKENWAHPEYDAALPFWKRKYGFWPMMITYALSLGLLIFVISII
jgi:hypothetical protein